MPPNRQRQMVNALEEVADLEDIEDHPNVRQLHGEFAGWYRLRAGVYRAILQPSRETKSPKKCSTSTTSGHEATPTNREKPQLLLSLAASGC